jgi:hypothetical protein
MNLLISSLRTFLPLHCKGGLYTHPYAPSPISFGDRFSSDDVGAGTELFGATSFSFGDGFVVGAFFGLGATSFFGLGATSFFGLGATSFFGFGATSFFGFGTTSFFGLGATSFFGLGTTSFFGLGATVFSPFALSMRQYLRTFPCTHLQFSILVQSSLITRLVHVPLAIKVYIYISNIIAAINF